MSTQTALTAAFTVLILDIAVILLTYGMKYSRARKRRGYLQSQQEIHRLLLEENPDFQSVDAKLLFSAFISLEQSVQIPEKQRQRLITYLAGSSLCARYTAMLRSFSKIRRSEAASALKYLHCRTVQKALLQALKKETHPMVILYIADALARQQVKKAIPLTVRKLQHMNTWYAHRLHAVLYTYKKDLLQYAKTRLRSSRIYIQRLFCGFALEYPAEELRAFLIQRAWSRDPSVNSLALRALLKHFPEELLASPFTSSRKRHIIPYVIFAYGRTPRRSHVEPILNYAGISSVHEEIFHTLSAMAADNPDVLEEVLQRFNTEETNKQKMLLARVLSNRIEYYLTRINSSMADQVIQLIEQLVRAKYISGILLFINRNQDAAIEAKLTEVLKRLMARNRYLQSEIGYYLHPAKLQKFAVKAPPVLPPALPPHQDASPKKKLIGILAGLLIFFPLVIFGMEFRTIDQLAWNEIGVLYVVRYNYLFIFYSAAINMIYLIMLGISMYAAWVQNRLWNIKDKNLLFTRHLLPAVTVIAPAHNEEASIIESTNSLLNQQFPNFELIVVNDGSKDNTLQNLIEYYRLEKQDRIVRKHIKTRNLKGIYVSRDIPNLIVVDKFNGGKADSLNMGINVSSKEFICGIDADSLLEPDALLKAVSVMLDTPAESFAAGGNIFPVNGCTVDRGALDEISLPKKFLPRLQSLEYLRAFMAGRVAWAHLNSLLIISGAFGIFDRKFVIRIGGYLTKSGKYQKDTVGEDMELVVRIARKLKELRIPYRIDYAFHANCWTEVPETWKSLYRQRDRWHRGLIDILLFHRKLIANPRYGRLGMVGMLYYVLFEFIGPFIESKGFLMVVISILIGAIYPAMALLLFTATILLGLLVSVSSVLICEFHRPIYQLRDVLKLLKMSFAENFGLRQFISFWRVLAYFNAMKKPKGWGVQTRSGFLTSLPDQAEAASPTDQSERNEG